jgi:two-component system NtrC family sensor kinase
MVGRNYSYIMCALILITAAPLGLFVGPEYAAAAAVLAGASFLQTRFMLSQIRRGEQERHNIDEQICRVEKLSTVDELSAGIAHEINNPLAIMAQEAQWIQHIFASETLKGLKEIEECKDSLQEILSQVDRCREIVLKLLSLAQNAEPVIQSFNVNELVHDMSRILEREIAFKTIKIAKNLQPKLPIVYSDPPLLRQVLLNLLVNASQAIDRDGEICITTSTHGNNEVEITVSDNGCGIPQEYMDRIFTPFFSTKSQGKGTGLGLAICRGIIERLGGRISVASDAGRSTVFTIHLPIKRFEPGETNHAL